MGKTEFIIIGCVIIFVTLLFLLYFYNSKRMKNKKEQSEIKGDSAPKTAKTDSSATLTKSEQKELEKAKESVKTNIKEIMENVSTQSENYIKSLDLQIEQNKQKGSVSFEEVSNEELLRDEKAEEEAAIILGVKKKQVHVFEDDQENFGYNENYDNEANNDYDDYESSSSILTKLDNAKDATISKASSEIQLENFEEDDSVAEEFQDLSSRMKIMMMTDVFKRKYNVKDDDENREE